MFLRLFFVCTIVVVVVVAVIVVELFSHFGKLIVYKQTCMDDVQTEQQQQQQLER